MENKDNQNVQTCKHSLELNSFIKKNRNEMCEVTVQLLSVHKSIKYVNQRADTIGVVLREAVKDLRKENNSLKKTLKDIITEQNKFRKEFQVVRESVLTSEKIVYNNEGDL